MNVRPAASSLFLLLTAAVLLSTAGCITEPSVPSPAIDAVPAVISDEFRADLNAFASDMMQLEEEILIDLAALANEMGRAETPEAMEQAARMYYAENPWVISVAYHDAVNTSTWTVPIATAIDISVYAISPTEDDFNKSNGFIIRHGLFYPDHGYVSFFCRAVYDREGSYCGVLVFIVDPYIIANTHPFMLNRTLSYANYIGFIADSTGRIFYSSVGEAIGKQIPEGEGYYDHQSYVPDTDSASGACKYTSNAFYNYDINQTDKITAWQTITSSVSGRSVIYLIQEADHPEPETGDVYPLFAGKAINDTRDAFLYAYSDGKLNLSYRIKSGYYSTPIRIMSMKGTVISAADPDIEGVNYLNSRGSYGMSYMLTAVFVAEQGGGYIYFYMPVEHVVRPQFAAYCLARISPLDNTCFTEVIFPGNEDMVPIDYALRSDVIMISRAVMRDAAESGVDAVAAKINANQLAGPGLSAGNVSAEILDIAIMDIYGNVYASLISPELAGTSATGMTDVYGGSTTRRAIMLVKTGSDVFSQVLPSEKEGYVDMWMVSVEPIDDIYYVYTSARIGTFEDVLTPYLR